MTSLVTWLKQETRRRALSALNNELADLEVQRYAEFGRVGASLLHDLSTPLTAATITLSELQAEQSNRQLRRALSDLKRLESYIKVARQQLKHSTVKRSFLLRSVIRQAVMILDGYAKLNNVKLIMDLEAGLAIKGDPVKLQQALTNLIANAIESYDKTSGQHRQVIVKSKQVGLNAILTVVDRGQGIKKADLDHIFDPFFSTTQEIGRGIGIGLAIVKSTIEKDFNGRVYVQSEYLAGTKFTIILPLVRKS